MERVSEHPKVFLSYRSTDRAVVAEFAERLRRDGVDAWYDCWEIAPGDDIVAKMDQGIDGCVAGLIFVSRVWFDGEWVQDEYTSLVLRKVEDGIRLVPVLLEDVADQLPARLRKLARRSVADYEAIRDTLLGIDRRPGVSTALHAPARVVTIRLEDTSAGRATVSLLVDGQVRAREAEVRVPGGLRLGSLGSAAFAGLRQQVGSVLLPGAVGRVGEQLLAELDAITVADVHIEASPALASLPWEAVVTPAGHTPVLQPGVRMRRGLIGQPPNRVPPAAGPLKILVAVGAPDETKTTQARLDIEDEMGSILDAVAPAVRDERAQVRILEVANATTITAALVEDDYHVLHLSGHGDETGIELEDEDGAPVLTRAADLADALRSTGRVVPLVFLSSCHGAGDPEGLALALHRLGLPRVIAMQAPVTDRYATELAAEFYGQLSVPAFPRAGVALARARQELAKQGGNEAAQSPSPEWATATLTATDDGPLIDGDLDLVALRRPPVHLATGPVPALGVGELIGRRVELRETLRALRDERRSVVLTGIGGVGKSSVAGRVTARLAEQGWVCSVTTGAWSLETLCAVLLVDLLTTKYRWAQDLHNQLAALPPDDPARLRFLDRVLRQYPVLLVLDNFEDNLTPEGAAFTDAGTAAVMERLAESCSAGRLLVTCRYSLPGLHDQLRHYSIGPLSHSETRRLFLRLEGLRTLTGDDAALVHRLVGGHPRVLEFLDALRRRGASSVQVRRKFLQLASAHRVKVTQPRELHQDVAAAVQLGARDICLDLLLSALDATEREVLLQTAVSALPVPMPDLTAALADSGLDDTAIKLAAQRLADLSLVVNADEELWVHRWTAEGLRAHQPLDNYYHRCLRAGELRLRRIASHSRDVGEGIEATQNFLDAKDWDRATEVATGVANFLAQDSNLRRLSFAAQVLSTLPTQHRDYHLFVDHEGESLVALGFTTEALDRYLRLVDTFTQRARSEPGRADYQRDLSISYNKLGDLYQALGQGEQALQLYQQSLDIRERLARSEPSRADYQRDLSISYERLGDLYQALGQGEQALQLYQQSLDIAERLARSEPSRADYQRDLSISYNKLGDLYRALGQGEQALQLYQQSLDIAERLARSEPSRADYQRDLSISYNKLGDLYRALGQGEQALQLYQQSLDIAERLARSEPSRADYQRDLSISYNKLGDLYQALGQGEQALQLYQQSLDIRERLARSEPSRADYQRDLSISYNKLGDLYQALGQGEQALQLYQQSLDIAERLARSEPSRADYQRDLSISYNKLGDLYQALGQGEQALQLYQQSLDIAERLARSEPSRADYQRDLSISYERLGDLYQALGQGEQALQLYQQSLDIAERLARSEPSRADYQRDLSISYNKLGDLYQALGQGEQALQLYQQSLDIRERLARSEPSRADYQRDLSISYNKLGDLYQALGQGEQALQLYQQSLDIRERLARSEPSRADYQRDLSISYNKLGTCFTQLNRAEEAVAALKRHLQLALDVHQRMPGQVDAVVDLAIALHLTADLDDHGDERNQQSRELLEVLESDQRLPHHGKALLDKLRQDHTPPPQR